jgi:acetyl esterase/lipase
MEIAMKLWMGVLGMVLVSGWAGAQGWQPSAGHKQVAIWPGVVPDAQVASGPEHMSVDPKSLIAGKTVVGVDGVSRPTMTVYAPKGKNTWAAVVVFPGGGYQGLAIDLEGTEVCDWLTAKGCDVCVVEVSRAGGAGVSEDSVSEVGAVSRVADGVGGCAADDGVGAAACEGVGD